MTNLLPSLRAAGEPTRLRILAILAHGALTVTELTHVLRQSQPRISRHLKLLADTGLVERFPEASWIFYRLNRSGMQGDLVNLILSHISSDEHSVEGDLSRLDLVRSERRKRADHYFSANAAHWDQVQALYIPETEVEAHMSTFLPSRVDRLVDLGTGIGRMLEVFGPTAREAIGFDLNPEMLTLARTKLARDGLTHCDVRQSDITNLPLDSECADLCILHQVLHFLDDPEMAIGEAARVLRVSGRLLIADFAPHELENLRHEHAHRRLGFSEGEVSDWLKRSGLTLTEVAHLSASGEHLPSLTVTLWVADKTDVTS